ncbi:hypothetical protein C0991_002069 [Blastosporella zonata]|nr:hypothetical protein C0991_002069 [Blastosporella zonata]
MSALVIVYELGLALVDEFGRHCPPVARTALRSNLSDVAGRSLHVASFWSRMTNLLLEPLCIAKWVDTISMRAQPPGHVIWEPPTPVKECTWVPSGSFFSPGGLKSRLISARSVRRKAYPPLATFSSVLPRTSERRSSKSNRKALVFEHEVTLNTDGRTKRWSLQVPAETMNPEMVDIMLELQDLNSFFKDSLTGLDRSVAVLEKEKGKLASEPPALIVSDSHRCFPLSNGSLEQAHCDVPLTIAARRGRRLLPPLTLGEAVDEDPYPSIPTAFLGSPSSYSPKFECVGTGAGPSLDLEHMVTNLRSQCAFPRSMDDPGPESLVHSPLSDMSFAEQGSSSDDDWAFAVSFLDEVGNHLVGLNSTNSSRLPDIIREDLATKAGLPSNESVTPRANSSAYSPSPVPSTPLPALPVNVPQEPSLVCPSPRGILKSCKNVRFATLPDRSAETRDEVQGHPFTPQATASSVRQPANASSRIHAYTHSSLKQTAGNPSPLIPVPQNSPQSTNKSIGKATGSRPVSTSQGEHSRNKPTFVVHRTSPRPRSAVALGRKASTDVLGRQPLSRLDSSDENQESKSTPTTPHTAGLRWTMNDMTFRRGSSSQVTPEGTPKSRMPVPLRNIWTRFK